MDAVSPYPVLPIILVALATMWLSGKLLHIRPAEGRFAPIDGLRGYMAFFVFLHHSCIWYYCVHGYGWGPPPSNLYSHFGPTSVSIFFMITSFLFFSKLLQARTAKIDWLKLYVGRVLRILPLYTVAICILVFIVGIMSHFTLLEPVDKVLWQIAQWLAFIKANINGIFPTWIIIAGVVWSLPYDWLFYFTLPFLGFFLGVRVSFLALIFALIGLLFFIFIIVEYQPIGALHWINPFLAGIAAAFLARNKKAKKLAAGPIISFCIVLLLSLVVMFFSSAHEIIPLLMLATAFMGIACGNSVFGTLTHPLSRMMGQISYSIYLLHGIILFVNFQWVLGFQQAGHFSPLEHWGIITICSIAVILISSITYRFIERPALNATPAASEKLRKQLARSKSIVTAKPLTEV